MPRHVKPRGGFTLKEMVVCVAVLVAFALFLLPQRRLTKTGWGSWSN